jgi:nucleotide-binding universal stress UspA family protein
MTTPINAIDRVSIVVPRDAFSAAAARQALKLVATIAEEINAPFTIFASRRHMTFLKEEYAQCCPDHPLETIEVTGDVVKAVREFPDTGDDLIVVATAGSERRFRSSMGRIPEELARTTSGSILVIRYT